MQIGFPLTVPPNAAVRLIGSETLVLRQHYDTRQHWFGFIQALLIRQPAPPREPQQNPAVIITHQQAARFASVPKNARLLYWPERGVAQLVLPFAGWRRINATEWKHLHGAQLPGWERGADGHPLKITTAPERSDEIAFYCHENCRGRYACKKTHVYFELKTDYVMARIAYSVVR
jgi:hypothetical protein